MISGYLQFGELNDNRDSQIYQTVKLGNKWWMAENLNTSSFLNGDIISEAKIHEEWQIAANKRKPAWCYYQNDPKNGEKYGKLYNFYAVLDSRGIAPYDWQVPTKED